MTIHAYTTRFRCYAVTDGGLCFEICDPRRFDDFERWLYRMELEGCTVIHHLL